MCKWWVFSFTLGTKCRLTFTPYSLPEGFGEGCLFGIALLSLVEVPEFFLISVGIRKSESYLKMIDMNIESSSPTLTQRVRKHLVCFTQHPVLRVLE